MPADCCSLFDNFKRSGNLTHPTLIPSAADYLIDPRSSERRIINAVRTHCISAAAGAAAEGSRGDGDDGEEGVGRDDGGAS